MQVRQTNFPSRWLLWPEQPVAFGLQSGEVAATLLALGGSTGRPLLKADLLAPFSGNFVCPMRNEGPPLIKECFISSRVVDPNLSEWPAGRKLTLVWACPCVFPVDTKHRFLDR